MHLSPSCKDKGNGEEPLCSSSRTVQKSLQRSILTFVFGFASLAVAESLRHLFLSPSSKLGNTTLFKIYLVGICIYNSVSYEYSSESLRDTKGHS